MQRWTHTTQEQTSQPFFQMAPSGMIVSLKWQLMVQSHDSTFSSRKRAPSSCQCRRRSQVTQSSDRP